MSTPPPQLQPSKRLNETEKKLISSLMNSPLLSNDDDNESETTSDFTEEESSQISEKPVETITSEKSPPEAQKHSESNDSKDDSQVSEIDIVDTGYKAVALYDYQACKFSLRLSNFLSLKDYYR